MPQTILTNAGVTVHDGSAARVAQLVYVQDGAAVREVEEIWAHDGTSARLVYTRLLPSLIRSFYARPANSPATTYRAELIFNGSGTAEERHLRYDHPTWTLVYSNTYQWARGSLMRAADFTNVYEFMLSNEVVQFYPSQVIKTGSSGAAISLNQWYPITTSGRILTVAAEVVDDIGAVDWQLTIRRVSQPDTARQFQIGVQLDQYA